MAGLQSIDCFILCIYCSIASPGYPGQYANNMNCDYYISVAQNMGVQITFDVFSTEDSYDIVTVYDGTGPLANELDE